MFEKDFYLEHPSVTARPLADVEAFRARHHIAVSGRDPPKPAYTFEEASFPSYITSQLASAGFPAPTAVQSQTWPAALSGRDVVAVAETGGGKTLAFLLPAIVHVNAQPYLNPGEGPIVLVLAPTRELASQIHAECTAYGASSRVKTACVYGGAPRGPQIAALRAGVEIVVATPGRLNDLVAAGATNLRRCAVLVLDEADRMLDLGFEPQIRKLVHRTRPDRQTMLFTATWPRQVADAARAFARDTVVVRVGVVDAAATSRGVSHVVRRVEEEGKYSALVRALEEALGAEDTDAGRVIVFLSSKARVDDVTRRLRHDGFPALSIHGDKSQEEREFVLAEFREGRAPVMLATDVAARGLDVKDVTLVVNHDFPGTMEDYVHRAGRTGRAGASGTAASFFTAADSRHGPRLEATMREAGQTPPEWLHELVGGGERAREERLGDALGGGRRRFSEAT